MKSGRTLEALASQFLSDARTQFHGSSPLYDRLSTGISEDREILSLASEARGDEPSVPLLFLGAVHFLLLREDESRLSRFYASTGGYQESEGDPYPVFRSFCLEHKNEIRRVISKRRVQTNEVRRCACLLPAFSLVHNKTKASALAMVEVGASAGLNLLWDRYGYDYGSGVRCGNPESPVQISCTLKGEVLPPLPSVIPPVGSRVGVDIDPIQLEDEDDVLWLRALVWPEHVKRAELLSKAIDFARRYPPRVVKGNALDALPNVLEEQPEDCKICIFDSNTLFRFSDKQLDEFTSLLADFSRKRELFQVSYEWWRGGNWQQLDLSWFKDGIRKTEHLGHGHPHGEWLQWVQQVGTQQGPP